VNSAMDRVMTVTRDPFGAGASPDVFMPRGINQTTRTNDAVARASIAPARIIESIVSRRVEPVIFVVACRIARRPCAHPSGAAA
jgi:hypothetical protein